jgi:hypothetical protein
MAKVSRRKNAEEIGRSGGLSYRWYSYDVWGNKKDGYDVNDVFRTNDVVFIPNKVSSDADMTKYLKKQGFFKKEVKNKFVEYRGDEHVIYVDYKGKPEGELRVE